MGTGHTTYTDHISQTLKGVKCYERTTASKMILLSESGLLNWHLLLMALKIGTLGIKELNVIHIKDY